METVQLFIGSDNDTGLLDTPCIENIVSKHHAGFTIWQAVGHWKGHQEATAVVLVSGDNDTIADTVRTLKSELRQDAIGVQHMSAMTFE